MSHRIYPIIIKRVTSGGSGTNPPGSSVMSDAFGPMKVTWPETLAAQTDAALVNITTTYADTIAAQTEALSLKLSGFADTNAVQTEAATLQAIFTATGTFTTPNDGITRNYTVECWGGGQGGAVGTSTGGTGGKGGDYARSILSLAPNTTFTVTVGAAPGAGGNGNDSWFNTATTIRAKGGNSANTTIGTNTFTGGTGAVGVLLGAGGGGGGGAGSTANGGNAGTAPAAGAGGGTAPDNGGNGGTGSGGIGTAPGGGSGGGVGSATSPGAATVGTRGQVKIKWTAA